MATVDTQDMTPERIAELRKLAESADRRSWGCKFLRQGTIEALTALEQARAERDAVTASWHAATVGWQQEHANTERLTAERDAAIAERDALRAQLVTGKPQPTQQENDDAAARLAAMEQMYERYGMDVKKWPQHALDTHMRLQAAQNDYEARYC